MTTPSVLMEADGSGPRQRLPVTPIVSERPWPVRINRASAHIAHVIVYRRGEHEVVWPHKRIRVFAHRRPTTIYEVNLGLYWATMRASLPSREDACPFRGRISVEWRVLDPAAVVRQHVYDVADALVPSVLRQVRGITRTFAITDLALAEDQINIRLGSEHVDIGDTPAMQKAMKEAIDRGRPGAANGLWTRIIAQLSLDDAAAEHAAKIAQLRWAIAEERAEYELKLLQERHQKQITADRHAEYRKIIAAGDIDRLALQLAKSPDDVKEIDSIIREELRESRRDTIDFVGRMVDSGVVERWEISDQAREALQWLRESTARVIRDQRHQEHVDPEHRMGRRGREQPAEASAEVPADSEPAADTRIAAGGAGTGSGATGGGSDGTEEGGTASTAE